METTLHNISIRPLKNDENVPWELLLDADPDRQLVDKYLPSCEIFVALLADEVIAEYALYPLNPAIWEIKNIAVIENLQGKGIGKMLLNHAADTARNRQVSTLVIGTSNASFAQLYLYQKCGFEISAIKYNFFLDNYPEPLFENNIQCKHMLMLTKQL